MPSAYTRYYAFDEAFVREVLGKKLSKGTKKDLDDISTKTGITLKSCRRQVGSAPPWRGGPRPASHWCLPPPLWPSRSLPCGQGELTEAQV